MEKDLLGRFFHPSIAPGIAGKKRGKYLTAMAEDLDPMASYDRASYVPIVASNEAAPRLTRFLVE